MERFDLSGHVLLCEEGQALTPELLAAHVEAASISLEVEPSRVAVGQEKRALLMMVHQVNYQISQDTEGLHLTKKTTGPVSRDFRAPSLLSPLAVEIRDSLWPPLPQNNAKAREWAVLPSFR